MKQTKNDGYVQAPSLKRYSFSDVEKMTSSFNDEKGQGGYGTVYKGKLLDNHLVAVKLLNTSESSEQELINEVVSISTISHFNIVLLLVFSSDSEYQLAQH